MREWLPGSIQGGGSSGSVGPQQVSVMSRVTNAIQPVREQTRNAANMAGLPVAAANPSAFDQCLPKLTLRQRLYGWAGCFGVGMVISFLSFISWWMGDTATWAIMYTFGNLISVLGSG